jgi:tRNA/tmRNA/rRNA uracil-C5-methylase (TrmA/RlmC/RlmD family)
MGPPRNRHPPPVPDVGPLQGALIEVDVGAPAHGGSCVARHDGRVVFVRHALPGERVLARVTEDRGGAYCRADAVELLVSSPDRVQPPCPHAGPGRCGGCDWQHASASAQRELKAAIVREQFARLAGIELAAEFHGVEGCTGIARPVSNGSKRVHSGSKASETRRYCSGSGPAGQVWR